MGVVSNYTDNARGAPPDSGVSQDSCRPDILGGNVLAASSENTVSSPPRKETVILDGRRFSKLTGSAWRRPIF